MTNTQIVADYLREGGAKNDEIDDFLDFVSTFKDGGKEARYECYRLWARLLRHKRTPYKKYDHFNFDARLKDYLRMVSKGDIVDAPPPLDATIVSPEHFVKFVVRYLDDAF